MDIAAKNGFLMIEVVPSSKTIAKLTKYHKNVSKYKNDPPKAHLKNF